MRSFAKVPAAWQRGLVIGLMAAVTLAAAFLQVWLVVLIGNALLGLFGYGIAEGGTINVALWLSPLWGPLALGYAARYFPDAEPTRRSSAA